jgi:hypothetical protein
MTEPWLVPRNPEELRECLGLLPEMVADPEFPFGEEFSFVQLGMQIAHLHRRIKGDGGAGSEA